MNDRSGPFEPFAVVVNDNSTQLSILSGLVRKAGLEPCAFTSAEAALADMSARAETCLPALVVTDIYMPGIDGWRFCRLLRSPDYAILNQIPILVVSAIFAGEEPDRIAADLGAEAFFTCPVDGRRFVEKVRGILQGDRRRIPPRVLIVKENRTRADALRKAFEDRGYRADAVLTAREAAEAFDRIAYDVAVLNYPLSEGSGDDLLDVFNAQRPDCVCLMTTASAGPEQALDWMKRGAAACLYKPFDPEYLIDLCTRTRRERSLLRVQGLLETRTRELRESEERYRNIFNNSVEGIYQATLEGRYRIVNQAFARMHGYDSPEEMTAAVTDIGKQLYVDPEQRKKLIALLSASEEKTIRNYELRLRRKDGSMLWVSLNSRLVSYSDDEDGLCIEGTCMDITQRKQAEEALIYRLACEHCTAECIGILAESGDIQDRIVRILEKLRSVANVGRAYIFENEYDPDAGLCMTQIAESCAKGVKSKFGNPDLQRLPYNDNFSSLLSALQSRKPYAGIVSDLTVAEREMLEPQEIVSILILPVFAGNALWGFIGFDDCEAPRQWRREDIRILATVADAAGAAILRHQAIAALRESEERHRTLVNGLPDFVIRYDRGGRHLFVSENVCRLDRIEADQYIGRTGREMGFPEAHCEFLEERIRQVFDTGAPLETEFTFEGEQGPMLFNWRLLPEFDANGAVKSLLSISRDITERRRMEHEYRILFREMLDGFALQDVIRDEAGNPVDYRFRALNPAFERMIDLRAADIAGRTVLEVLPDIDRCWIDTFGKVALTGEPAFFERFSKIMGKHVETTVFRPAPDQIAVISVDVTERKQAEEALRQFKTVFDAANFGMAISDLNGVLIYINDCFARAHGYEAGDLVGQPLMRLHNEEQREQVEGLIRRTVSENVFDAQEVWHCRRDGTPFPMLMTGTLIRDADRTPKYFAATAIDLAERKNLEAQLAQAQKMESVGRLAGGVAHDFNNMLSVILGYADMALNRADTTHPLYHALTQIRNSAVRSADLTRQLLAFARRQTIAPRALDINETVEGMLKMIQRLIGEDIDLAWRPKPEVWPVLMDPSQLDQILANLCVNARDAIAGVGRITIETENIVLDEAYCSDHEGFVPGNYVMIAVSDDGQGMGRETMSHLFEPFFTTKKAGKGTGLGLSTIYGAVKQNKGFINVYSEPGKGSTFKIYLPRHAGEKGRKQAEEAEIPTLKGRETILLVEDEPMILDLAATILETQDYTVLQASTPGEAIRLAREHAGKINLLLTDVIMPEMNGRELAKSLLSLYPDMKRLFMSGYTADVIAHHGLLDEGVRFISKPFSMKGLIAKVREVLDDGKEEKSCGPADGNRLNQRNSAHK